MIDLHSHSRHSDGEYEPARLLAEAAAAGIEVLSLTDHDTVSGIAEGRDAAREYGIRLVPGIEISCELAGRELHVLGHFLDPQAASLSRLSSSMLAERRERMAKMIALAQQLGFSRITSERVLVYSGGENFGRPHLARALVECGHASSVKDAFEKFLHTRGPLWVDRRRQTVAAAVAVIREAGGTSSLAHPGLNEVSREELKFMAGIGLDAVEAHHPKHPPEQAQTFEVWAADFNLLVTAGSDYHGPNLQLYRKLGDRTLSRERFAALEELSRRALVTTQPA